jgi:hypothetical protein
LRFEQLSREGLLRRLSPFELRDGMPGELLLLKSVKRTPSKRTNPSKGRQPEIAIARLHNVAH